LFQFLLAGDAMARPRYSFQPLGVNLIPAREALSKNSVADTIQSALHHLQELPFVIALVKQEFLVIRVCRPVPNVLRRLQISIAAVLGSSVYGLPQIPLAGLQALFECV
jgi:hypothetical protein